MFASAPFASAPFGSHGLGVRYASADGLAAASSALSCLAAFTSEAAALLQASAVAAGVGQTLLDARGQSLSQAHVLSYAVAWSQTSTLMPGLAALDAPSTYLFNAGGHLSASSNLLPQWASTHAVTASANAGSSLYGYSLASLDSESVMRGAASVMAMAMWGRAAAARADGVSSLRGVSGRTVGVIGLATGTSQLMGIAVMPGDDEAEASMYGYAAIQAYSAALAHTHARMGASAHLEGVGNALMQGDALLHGSAALAGATASRVNATARASGAAYAVGYTQFAGVVMAYADMLGQAIVSAKSAFTAQSTGRAAGSAALLGRSDFAVTRMATSRAQGVARLSGKGQSANYSHGQLRGSSTCRGHGIRVMNASGLLDGHAMAQAVPGNAIYATLPRAYDWCMREAEDRRASRPYEDRKAYCSA